MNGDPGRDLRRAWTMAEFEALGAADRARELAEFRARPFVERRAAATKIGLQPGGRHDGPRFGSQVWATPKPPACDIPAKTIPADVTPPPIVAVRNGSCWAVGCGRTDTRRYLNGDACPDHTPARSAGRPESGERRYTLTPLGAHHG